MPDIAAQRRPFHLTIEFDTLEDFAGFCAILRGEKTGDDATLRSLAARLDAATTTLAAAETGAAPAPHK